MWPFSTTSDLRENITSLATWQGEIREDVRMLNDELRKERVSIEALQKSVAGCISEISELRKLSSALNLSDLRKSIDEINLWKAGLMAELVKESPAGRPRKTALWGRLKNR